MEFRGLSPLVLAFAYATLAAAAHAQAPANPHGALATGCSTCHRADAWKPAAVSGAFRHAESVFPLDGAHTRTACLACHRSLDFAKAPVACASCHNDPHNGELGTQCARCHTTRSFSDLARMRTTHEATRFPLRGAHAAVQCTSCHAAAQPGQMRFAGRPTTCISCHADNYRTSTTPDHQAARMSQDCASCHSVSTWTGARFDHSVTRFPLDGGHRTVACIACHADRVYVGKPTDCATCHLTNYNQAAPSHPAAGFPTTCLTCHTTATWLGAPFDHSTTQFPLTGAHVSVVCASCHADGVFRGRGTACVSCHQPNYNAAMLPPHSALAFSTACTTCHTQVSWQPATFDHATTQFTLTGAHRAASCQNCHADNVYRGKPTTCVSCHQAKYTATTTPPHAASGFPTTCETCHNTTGWTGSPFNHAATLFPLAGAHATVPCASCHGDGVYKGKPTTCISCHQSDFNTALLPPHASLGFSTVCLTCHTNTGWQPATFNHATTLFALTGAHLAASCTDCHADKVYKGKPTTCVSCHQARYTATTTPPHSSSGFPTSCETCHNTAGWTGSPFNHASTQFPLAGAHATVPCTSCHGDGVYKGKPTTCISCHQADFTGALLPPHASLGFSPVCSTCHTNVGWQPASFNHATTLFALTGAHLTTTCLDCHADKVYKGKPTTCVSCHQAKYAATTTPPHAPSGFPTTCETCHTTTAWLGSPFNHAATLFPLAGAHATVPCASCHGDGVYKGKPTTCISCHQADFTGALLPPHASLGFSTVCSTCHTNVGWQPATFDHSATLFALTGAHLAASCSDCHADKVYKGKPTTCMSCHQAKYTATTTPPHAPSGFPTTCETCHTTTAWLGSTFNHATTLFPLAGAHATVPCASCHGDGVYKGKPTTCVSCHQADFTGALLPPHASLGFSTVCSTCHTNVGWQPASFDHSTTLFPLAGAHLAASCNDCHADKVYKGKPITCVSCHQAKYTATTNPPHAAAGFGTTCQSCHGTTDWLSATFNHTATKFPLTGAHTGLSCNSCHADGVYVTKSTLCSGCHLTDYNGTSNPAHAAAGFPTTCDGCHTTTTWLGATFNHDASYFPIYSGNHKGRWTLCADCHTSSSNYAVFICTTCHTKSTTDSHHTGKSGYVYDSPHCYSCHPRGSAG